MNSLQDIVDSFRRECAEDYIGLWQISRAVRKVGNPPEHLDLIVSVVEALLQQDHIAIGQFDGERFVEWQGDSDDQVMRLRRELLELGKDPDIGEIGWLTRRPAESR
jgi:hypothetical protein